MSAEKVIDLIQQSEDVPFPDNQLAMPYYCDTKIGFLKDAIDLIEDEIKDLRKLRKTYIMNINNMNTNNFQGGKRRKQRKTRKNRK